MVKTYSYSIDKDKKISAHFTVGEFSSTSPSPYSPTRVWDNNVLISEELIFALEHLIKVLNVKSAVVSSGYRSANHDIAVGGNGKGQHVYGKAVDISLLDKNNKPIDTRIVSCVAQDTKLFNGIARINSSYIHLDVGNRAVPYYGDETKNYNTVTNNFYNYYGISKSEVNKYVTDKEIISTSNSSNNNFPTITYQVYTNKWLPSISNSNLSTVKDYAGMENIPIHAIKITTDKGKFKYRVHMKENNSWTPWTETNKDNYCGILSNSLTVDGIQIDNSNFDYNIYYSVSVLNNSNYYAKVKNLEDYAGVFGRPIDKVIIYLEKK